MPWRSVAIFVLKNWFLCTDATNDDAIVVLATCWSLSNNIYSTPACVRNVQNLSQFPGHSSFEYLFGHVDDAASENIREVISMGSGLMWNDSDVCGGNMDLNIFVMDLSECWKSLERKSAIILLVPLM